MEELEKINDIKLETNVSKKIEMTLKCFNLTINELSELLGYTPNFLSGCKQKQFKISDKFIKTLDLFLRVKELEILLKIERIRNKYN